jgi:Protein of unknown function (DUF3626)
VLDSGVEAQVHGPIHLLENVELLVEDPAFVGTATGTILYELANYEHVDLPSSVEPKRRKPAQQKPPPDNASYRAAHSARSKANKRFGPGQRQRGAKRSSAR